MPRPLQVDLYLLTLKVVSESCDMGYLCANFSLPRPLCSRHRAGVRDRRTSDAHHHLITPTIGVGTMGHNKGKRKTENIDNNTVEAYQCIT